ncbi:MAG: class I SAM-dependent methyltransferase [Actinomycetota bacterium]|nr:class I SAM-dependent methyltransferase [Actinomycetota bacterium]
MSGANNYIGWLASLAEPYLGDQPLEIGAGMGDYAEVWAGRDRVITVSEADAGRLAVLRERFAGRPDVLVRELEVPITDQAEHSAVVAYNVLEHIEDDVAALRSFAGLVRPGGHVILIVPAFMIAMSAFDREIGHHRRYRAKPLAAAIRAAGLQPVVTRYVNPVGLVGWIVLMRLLGKRTDDTPVAFFDRYVVPVLRRIETRVRPPFGQSVFAVARVPG